MIVLLTPVVIIGGPALFWLVLLLVSKHPKPVKHIYPIAYKRSLRKK